MYQDMKNFSDITAIDINNQLEVDIEIIKHNDPDFAFSVNGIPLESKMYFGLLDQIRFSCKISKGAVEVARITINGKEVLPIYQHLATPATNWITADWEFVVPALFYPWYHEITGQGWIA
jgi:hypothetical protein